jgi:hypothetical protein
MILLAGYIGTTLYITVDITRVRFGEIKFGKNVLRHFGEFMGEPYFYRVFQ